MASRVAALALGTMVLLLHVGWTWVGLFVSGDVKGEWFLWDLKEESVTLSKGPLPVHSRATKSLASHVLYRQLSVVNTEDVVLSQLRGS